MSDSPSTAQIPCPRCGSMVNSDAFFCGACGHSLRSQWAPDLPPMPAPPPPPSFDLPPLGRNEPDQVKVKTNVDAFAGIGSAPSPVTEYRPAPGDMLAGRFRIIKALGEGGMGFVYVAEDTELEGNVALKLLRPELSHNELVRETFRREVAITRKLDHPYIIRTFDIERDGDRVFFTMDYVDGPSIGTELRRAGRYARPFEPLAVARYALQVAEALQYAHGQGIVHRDVKPDNVLLHPDGSVRLTDFGIARVAMAAADFESGNLGTQGYQAPEQRNNPATVDGRADLYSLGVVVYEMLTGQLPGSFVLNAAKLNPGVPRALDEVVSRAIQVDPNLRYASAAEMIAALQGVVGGGAKQKLVDQLAARPEPAAAVPAGPVPGGLAQPPVWVPRQPNATEGVGAEVDTYDEIMDDVTREVMLEALNRLTPDQRREFMYLYTQKRKSSTMGRVLCVVAGWFGGQKFYIGSHILGILLIGAMISGIFGWVPVVLAIIDFFRMGGIIRGHNDALVAKTLNAVVTHGARS